MLVKQISVFLENKVGRLAEVTKILGKANINMSALVVSDTAEFGILRLIADDTSKAYNVLKENGFTVSLTDVVVVEVLDKPGSLHGILDILEKSQIAIEYMYVFLGRKEGKAPAVFRFEEPDKALEILKNNGVTVLSQEEL